MSDHKLNPTNVRTLLMNALAFRRTHSIELIMNFIEAHNDRRDMAIEMIVAIDQLLTNNEMMLAIAFAQKAILENVDSIRSTRGFDHTKEDPKEALGVSDEHSEKLLEELKHVFDQLRRVEESALSIETCYEGSISVLFEMLSTHSLIDAAMLVVGILHTAMQKALEHGRIDQNPITVIKLSESTPDLIREKLERMIGRPVVIRDIENVSLEDILEDMLSASEGLDSDFLKKKTLH